MVSDVIKPPLVALYRGYKQIDTRYQTFAQWRTARPFWGGVLLIFGGFIAGYTPMIALQDFLLRQGSAQLIGILGTFFAIAMVMSGVGVIINPELSNLLGMVGITFSILSTLVGNFGGLLIGTVTGIIGGALCIAWRRTDIPAARRARTGARPTSTPRGRPRGGAAEEADIEELREKAERYEQLVEEGDDDVVTDPTSDDETGTGRRDDG